MSTNGASDGLVAVARANRRDRRWRRRAADRSRRPGAPGRDDQGDERSRRPRAARPGPTSAGAPPAARPTNSRRRSSTATFWARRNAPAATQNPTVSEESPVAGAERRRPHEEHQRGRDRGERRLASEREPVGDRGHAPDREHGEQDGAVGGGRGRRRGAQQVPPAGELRSSACHVSPLGSPSVVVDGSSASTHEDREADERPGARRPTPATCAAAPARRGRAGGAPRREHRERRSGRSRRRAPSESAATALSAASANGARKRARRAMSAVLARETDRAGEGLVPGGRERRSRRVDHEHGTRSAGTAAGRVSTTTTPMPVSAARACSVSGRTRPRITTTRSTRRCARRFSSTARQPVALVGADRGQRVDHVVPGVAAGAEHLAGTGDDLDPPTQPHEARGDRCRRLDRDLERLRVVRAGAARRAPPRRATATGPRPGGSSARRCGRSSASAHGAGRRPPRSRGGSRTRRRDRSRPRAPTSPRARR